MWELDCGEGWALKNWCFWAVVLEKTLESLFDCREIKPVNSGGNQSWIFIGRTDVEAEVPILWPPDVKSWFIRKNPDAGNNRTQEKGTTEDSWMASLTQWTWVWVRSRSWRWTRKPGVLQSMGSKRIGQDWTELNWVQASGEGKKKVNSPPIWWSSNYTPGAWWWENFELKSQEKASVGGREGQCVKPATVRR